VFVICSTMAMVSGVVLASEIGVNNAEGGGNTLLLAVGAAVIGGTSLFGGKGKITDAVIGGLVVAVIINGMSDLLQGQNNAAYQAIVTGGVLLAASTVDALSRRRAGASGLA
jgi:D-xylose transport system permease protein